MRILHGLLSLGEVKPALTASGLKDQILSALEHLTIVSMCLLDGYSLQSRPIRRNSYVAYDMHKVSNVRLATCSPQTQTPLDALAYYTTQDMTSSQKHIVAFVLQAWGKHHLAYPTVRLIIL